LPINANTIARRRFRMNTGSSSNGTGSHSMKNTSGIDPRFGSPLQGSGIFPRSKPRALPWAIVECPFGALEHDISSAKGAFHCSAGHRPRKRSQHISSSANGASHDSLEHRPRNTARHISQAAMGRPISSTNGATCIPISANGATCDSPGHRPGTRSPHTSQALKGRPIR
jgi:hypothetical protein